jgi:hypothetical protein
MVLMRGIRGGGDREGRWREEAPWEGEVAYGRGEGRNK